MNYTENIKNKFILGSIDTEQKFSISNTPVIHSELKTATDEMERLAKLNPTRVYVCFKIVGGAYKPPQEIVFF